MFMNMVLIATGILLCVGTPTNPQATRVDTVGPPAAARELAQSVFEYWKTRAKAHAGAVAVPAIDIEDVEKTVLAEPFREYELRGRNIDDYLASSTVDPTQFAGIERYGFPVLLRNNPVTTIVVIRNRDENGQKFDSNAGDFILWGYYANNDLVSELIRLRATHPDVSCVHFTGTRVETCFIVRDEAGHVLLGAASDSLAPLDESGRTIKDRIREERRFGPTVYEDD
jgi:hypothetical protein